MGIASGAGVDGGGQAVHGDQWVWCAGADALYAAEG